MIVNTVIVGNNEAKNQPITSFKNGCFLGVTEILKDLNLRTKKNIFAVSRVLPEKSLTTNYIAYLSRV